MTPIIKQNGKPPSNLAEALKKTTITHILVSEYHNILSPIEVALIPVDRWYSLLPAIATKVPMTAEETIWCMMYRASIIEDHDWVSYHDSVVRKFYFGTVNKDG